jgi:hypothetical protein
MLQLGQRPAAQWDNTPQVLFKEARRRRRRRWLIGGVAVVLVSAMTAALALTWVHRMPGPSGARSAGAASGGGAGSAQAALAVWSDGTHLLTGDIDPGGRVVPRVLAEANVSTLPLVRAGQRVYWVDPAGAFVPELGHWSQLIRYLDLATGKIATAGPGQTVFLSADGRYLLMSQTATSMTQTPVAGGTPRTLTLPPGWYLPGGDGLADEYSGAGLATANGILVEAGQSPSPGGAVIGLWNPAGHRVTVIGRARAAIGAYTPPGVGRTQLAWIPAGCGDCPVRITDTATMAVRSVRSPLGHGFALGGGFSPDGTILALFVRADLSDAGRLMLVDLATGTAKVAREPQLDLGAAIGWARWLPDGRRLVMGPASAGGGYLVDTATLSAKPLVVLHGHGQDPNYTTVLVPPSR